MRKYILIMLLLCWHGMARGQTSDYSYFYWFDNDASTLRSYQSSATSWQQMADADGLSEAMHTVHVVVSDGEGRMSQPITRYFMKYSDIVPETKVYYWFDNESMPRLASQGESAFLVDASALSDGFHLFHSIATQGNYAHSSLTSNYFLKTTQVNDGDSLSCLCIVDGELKHVENLPNSGGIIHWNVDMHDIPDGLHRIQLTAVTMSGAMCKEYSAYFIRVTSAAELGEMRGMYAIDGADMTPDGGVMGENGNYHVDLDMSALSDGLHRISYVLYNDHGTSTAVQTRFFIKIPNGGNGLTEYQYWLNDQDFDQVNTISLAEKQNPLQLIALLPVETQPLRSKQFHFEIKDGQPMMYASNTIHLRFTDVAQRFSDVAKDYTDYSVSLAVTDISDLESGDRVTADWPEENSVKWYKMTAGRGDSLVFRLNIAATMQLFSPSGAEVYRSAGSTAVKWGGCHAPEDGTYYLAVHDVTATQGNTYTLAYERIDRYAVLKQDVNVVGNQGCSSITFDGNGFDELESVDLIMGQDTIESVEIKAEGKAHAIIKFDFDGAALGDYKAEFHFAEGNIVRQNCVGVTRATPISISVQTISKPTFNISRRKTYFSFNIHNSGNVTAYFVPILIQFFTHTEEIDRIEVKGFDFKNYYRDILGEQYTDSLEMFIDENRAETGDKQFFYEADSVGLIDGGAAHGCERFVLPELPPNTTKEITVCLELAQTVDCNIWYPNRWNNYLSNSNRSNIIRKRAPGLVSKFFSWFSDHVNWFVYQKPENCDLIWDTWVNSNYTGTGGGKLEEWEACSQYFHDNKDKTLVDKAIEKELIRVSAQSKAVTSFDPNDIYGYQSESGCKFIADSVEKVNYTIEFENDTALATAAAQTIVIKDTLDGRYFDLSSFVPKSVKIGTKEATLKESDVQSNSGQTSFVTTIDMRPEIQAIAQVEGEYIQQTGIAEWRFTSLDPMTMETVTNVEQGILPVNFDGISGIGEVMFEVGVKPNKGDGTEIPNRACIIFDSNEPIMTPTWVNTVDAVPPTSTIIDAIQAKADTLTLQISGEDNRSGVWKYDVYYQAGRNASWELVAANLRANTAEGATETLVDVPIFEGIEYGFLVLATDSAGNVEQKAFEPDFELSTVKLGDANSDGNVDALDVVLVTSYYLGNAVYLNLAAADVNGDGEVNSLDVVAMQNIYLNAPSGIKARTPRRRKVRNDNKQLHNE